MPTHERDDEFGLWGIRIVLQILLFVGWAYLGRVDTSDRVMLAIGFTIPFMFGELISAALESLLKLRRKLAAHAPHQPTDPKA